MRSFVSESVVVLASGLWPGAQKKCFGFVSGAVSAVAVAPTIPKRGPASARVRSSRIFKNLPLGEWDWAGVPKPRRVETASLVPMRVLITGGAGFFAFPAPAPAAL